MRTLKLKNRRTRIAGILALGLLVASATIGFLESRADATTASRLALDPANLAALNAPTTALSGVPAAARLGSGYNPAPGTVHQLGHGAALAWVAAGKVCWSSGHQAGCVMDLASAAQAIDPGVGDPDGIRQGQPAIVSGLAVDGVSQVSVTLKDGTRLTTKPVGNWYEIELPASAAPWDVTRLEATMSSGAVIPYNLPAVAPPGA